MTNEAVPCPHCGGKYQPHARCPIMPATDADADDEGFYNGPGAAGVDVPVAPTEEVIGYVHKDWEPTQGQGRIYGHRPGSDYVPVTRGVKASLPMQPTPYGLAGIEGDAIVIRLTADACAFAFANDPQAREPRPPVTDKQQFLRDTLNELTAEREDGSTPLTDMLDRAMVKAMENGSDALDHDAAPGVKAVHPVQEYKPCPDCSGSGIADNTEHFDDCKTCNGSGTVGVEGIFHCRKPAIGPACETQCEKCAAAGVRVPGTWTEHDIKTFAATFTDPVELVRAVLRQVQANDGVAIPLEDKNG